MGWFAVRSSDPRNIARELGLERIRTSNWEEGLKAAMRSGSVFVTPEISGWSLIVGNQLPSGPQEECLALLADLSRAFDEAQYFGTEDVTEFHAWAKASNGRLRRAYAFSGEQGAVLWDRGEVTEEEKDLGLHFPEATILSNSPDSSSVFQIAARWSLDPTRLDEVDCSISTGLLGER
jgi:hypothetical protein